MHEYEQTLQLFRSIYEQYLKPFAKDAPQDLKFRVVDIYTEIIALEVALKDPQDAQNQSAHQAALDRAVKQLIQMIASVSVLTPHYNIIKGEIAGNLT